VCKGLSCEEENLVSSKIFSTYIAYGHSGAMGVNPDCCTTPPLRGSIFYPLLPLVGFAPMPMYGYADIIAERFSTHPLPPPRNPGFVYAQDYDPSKGTIIFLESLQKTRPPRVDLITLGELGLHDILGVIVQRKAPEQSLSPPAYGEALSCVLQFLRRNVLTPDGLPVLWSLPDISLSPALTYATNPFTGQPYLNPVTGKPHALTPEGEAVSSEQREAIHACVLAFNQIIRKLAEENRALLVDFPSEEFFLNHCYFYTPGSWGNDGLHPNTAGHLFIASKIITAVCEHAGVR